MKEEEDEDDDDDDDGSHASKIVSISASYSQLLCLNLSWGLAVQFVISVYMCVCVYYLQFHTKLKLVHDSFLVCFFHPVILNNLIIYHCIFM